jgi:hypothetical protein
VIRPSDWRIGVMMANSTYSLPSLRLLWNSPFQTSSPDQGLPHRDIGFGWRHAGVQDARIAADHFLAAVAGIDESLD